MVWSASCDLQPGTNETARKDRKLLAGIVILNSTVSLCFRQGHMSKVLALGL
jgi:hypothetical protein